ncbi:gluconokinase [Labrenzia sp. CE80]|uniref:gluconokinase n=1 Tax=Labrenzia sp. CE80 TaxID=1788986 RepID=UPI001389BFE4|nr:gluconokinase [Labrenzia sp. CE80]
MDHGETGEHGSGAVAASPVIVMGVCGVGKSLLARRLADAFGVAMVEADDFHSDENRRKMSQDLPLTDADRLPWLDAVSAAAKWQVQSTGGAIVACSCLRRVYRDRIRGELGSSVFLHLAGPRALIAERLEARTSHFVGAGLLDSQLDILEPLQDDESGIALEINVPIDDVVVAAIDELRRIGAPAQSVV